MYVHVLWNVHVYTYVCLCMYIFIYMSPHIHPGLSAEEAKKQNPSVVAPRSWTLIPFLIKRNLGLHHPELSPID